MADNLEQRGALHRAVEARYYDKESAAEVARLRVRRNRGTHRSGDEPLKFAATGTC